MHPLGTIQAIIMRVFTLVNFLDVNYCVNYSHNYGFNVQDKVVSVLSYVEI